MSFIAKFYLVKMFPRKDSISIAGDSIKIKAINVINEILNKDVPEDVTQHFELKINGEVVLGADTRDAWEKTKFVWKGTEYTLGNYKELKDTTFAVGDSVELLVPNTLGLKSGDKVNIEVYIKQDRPVKFKIQRVVA
ncbi:MAG: hypothetical protein ACTSU5_07870 [Promethearchaeota archaeon]